MTLAFWRPARRSDRGALAVFECAEPPKPPPKSAATNWQLRHPRQWEYEAQQMIRGLASRVPTVAPVRVYVAEDVEGLVGVVSWREVGGPAEVHLDVIGIANRMRHQGGEAARGLFRVALDEIEAAAIEAGADELYLELEVFTHNVPSQRLCTDMGFERLEQHPTGAETWTLKVPIGGAEIE